jgi:cytochrome c oxidase subunit 2
VRCPLPRQSDPRSRSGTRKSALVATLVAGAVLLSGCGAEFQRGYLPEPVTEIGPRVVGFWNWTWIAALAIGVLVWGLTLWCIVAYRRRKGDDTLPEQFRYNVPIEILYTVWPKRTSTMRIGTTV